MKESDKAPLLIVRADAGTRMGTGHVMRCIALAQAWEDQGGRVVFICAGNPLARLGTEGFTVIGMDAVRGSTEDAKETADLIRKHEAAWVALDGYQFDECFQKTLVETSAQILVVDDNKENESYHSHIVLNPNLHASEDLYVNRESHTKLLLGPQYAFLRKEFWEASKQDRSFEKAGCNVLVTLGGSDPDNVTLKVLKALESLDVQGVEIKVLVGQGNPHGDSLEREVEDVPDIELIRDAKNVAQLMAWADVAVSAAGSTSWEMAACGLPGILVVLAENQRKIARALHRTGAGINLGWHEDVEESMICDSFLEIYQSPELRKKMSQAAQSITDGLGAVKVARIMMDSL